VRAALHWGDADRFEVLLFIVVYYFVIDGGVDPSERYWCEQSEPQGLYKGSVGDCGVKWGAFGENRRFGFVSSSVAYELTLFRLSKHSKSKVEQVLSTFS
jgi:hypothetical protein